VCLAEAACLPALLARSLTGLELGDFPFNGAVRLLTVSLVVLPIGESQNKNHDGLDVEMRSETSLESSAPPLITFFIIYKNRPSLINRQIGLSLYANPIH
jgi:hypothetical protein